MDIHHTCICTRFRFLNIDPMPTNRNSPQCLRRIFRPTMQPNLLRHASTTLYPFVSEHLLFSQLRRLDLVPTTCFVASRCGTLTAFSYGPLHVSCPCELQADPHCHYFVQLPYYIY